MKTRLAIAAAIAVTAGACRSAGGGAVSAPAPVSPAAPRPSLVVMIAVDQLRADLLDRYDAVFTGGFRRLRERGRWFRNAVVDHAVTVSHPGHATIATGMHPSHHGIVDAAFYEGPPGARVFTDALEDGAETIVGAAGRPGVSPRRFLAPTLAEWIQAASGGAGRVVALGSGPYSSLLHAGRAHGDVYWYERTAARYVTSSFYRHDDPDWVTAFNTKTLPPLVDAAVVWDNGTPGPLRALADPDDSIWESDHKNIVFPHRLADAVPPGKTIDAPMRGRWFTWTPMLDGATLALAEAAVAALHLGQGSGIDYLGIVPGQIDDLGHTYGPTSQEQLDNLRRLDLELGQLFDALDREVGAGRWVLALSADHGITDIPEARLARGEKARRVSGAEMNAVLDRVKNSGAAGDPAAVARIVKEADFVADAMTPRDLFEGEARDPFVTLYRHSARPDRLPRFPLFDLDSGRSPVAEAGVAVRFVEGAMPDVDTAVHGSPYLYDRSVPIIFMGPGVAPGTTDEPARTVDVAPTLARLAGIAVPADLDGRPLPLTKVAESPMPKTWIASSRPTGNS
jgi:predicted AlkP superfamily pyrophosphatase or phosphodiesterase